jgi:hypothetical protein
MADAFLLAMSNSFFLSMWPSRSRGVGDDDAVFFFFLSSLLRLRRLRLLLDRLLLRDRRPRSRFVCAAR